MENKTIIPIAMASDNKYMPYTHVAIYSLLKNKSQDTVYNIYLLHSVDIKKKFIKNLNELVKKYDCLIEFIDMGNSYKNQKSKLSHISYTTFYRLLLPKLLNNVSRCIWLDGDIIVQKDLTLLYNIDMGDNYIAGVKDAYEVINPDYFREIGIKNLSSYINAGVAVWNLQQMRKDNLTYKFEELLKNNYQFMDQDIINVACFEKIKLLPLKYNAMSNFFDKAFGKLETMYNTYLSPQERSSEKEDFVIIHYCTYIKPWNKKFFLGNIWWEYAEKTPYYAKLKAKFIKANGKLSWFEKIFSVKNNGVHKKISILGIKFKIKSKRLVEREKINQIISNQQRQIDLLYQILDEQKKSDIENQNNNDGLHLVI